MPTICSKALDIEIGPMLPCWICTGVGDPFIAPNPPLPDTGARAKIVGYTDLMFPFIDRAATAGGPVWDGVFRWQDNDSDQPWCRWSIPIIFVTIHNQDAHVMLRYNFATTRWEISIAIQVIGGLFSFWNHYAADDGNCTPIGLSFPDTWGGNDILSPGSVTLELTHVTP